MITASEARARLEEGNQRFVEGRRALPEAYSEKARRDALVAGQSPFAIVLGCADSRAPAEIVFDQGLGDLFVTRVAGNIAAPAQIGSIEYAVAHFHTPLIVVLGHTSCGAVAATLEVLRSGGPAPSPSLDSLVDTIRPSVEPLLEEQDESVLLAKATHRNIAQSMATLTADSPILSEAVAEKRLEIVGAEYQLASGEVVYLSDDES